MTAALRIDAGLPPPGSVESGRPVLGVTRSACGRIWRLRLDAAGEAAALAVAQRCGMENLLARVLAGRGVSADEALAFVEPSVKRLLPDPSVLVDMDAAEARLADAVIRAERIALFGDYDVDGATSVAVLGRCLRACGLDPKIMIPDRLIDGYGPNPAAVRRLAASGATLLVTLDCGASSHAALAEAARLGLDAIVVDHHPAPTALPPAVAVVDPNRQDDLSGQGHLAAVGVTFLLAVALMRELRRRGRAVEFDLLSLLDLVALGTVADMVPLVGVNRAFVVKGLIALHRRRNAGLAALSAVARISGPVGCRHLGFLLGPRINAGGRIGDAALGARLLLTDDPAQAEGIAAELERLNRERQAIEEAMVAEALAQAGASAEAPAVAMVSGESWHAGVAGLVAARLKERLGRPAVAIAFSDASGEPASRGAGSGRSIPGVDLGAAIREAAELGLLVRGGGHAMACGLTIERARLAEFARFLDDRLAIPVAAAASDNRLLVDGLIAATTASPELVAALDRAGPFGAGCPEPVVVLPAHRVAWAEATAQGHVRLGLTANDGGSLRAIAYRAADGPLGTLLLAARGRSLHVAGTLSLNHWQGVARPQLAVRDAAKPAFPVLASTGSRPLSAPSLSAS